MSEVIDEVLRAACRISPSLAGGEESRRPKEQNWLFLLFLYSAAGMWEWIPAALNQGSQNSQQQTANPDF